MKIEVLLSCMYQNNIDIVTSSKIYTDVLIINQTDVDKRHLYKNKDQTIRMYNTVERGLSNSRNMALENAVGDVCLLCDDDEILADDYEDIIVEAFQMLPDAAVIAFDVKNKTTRLKPHVQRVGRLNSLKLASYQLALNRKQITEKNVRFDPRMGAGSGNGAGEENKFLLDCIKKNLPIYFVPKTIGEVFHGTSTWFFGYDEKFFYQRGIATRYMLGLGMSIIYGLYYLLAKYPQYKKDLPMYKAGLSYLRGIVKNDIFYQVQKEK